MKFKPWGAGKALTRVQGLGKALGAVGPVLEVVFHVVDERRRDSAEAELRRSRQDVRDGFTTAADELRDGCRQSIRQVLDEVFSPTLMAIQRERSELRAEQDGRADTATALEAQLKRCGDIWAATVRFGGGVHG